MGLDEGAAVEEIRLVRLAPGRRPVEGGDGEHATIPAFVDLLQRARHGGDRIADIAAKPQCCHRALAITAGTQPAPPHNRGHPGRERTACGRRSPPSVSVRIARTTPWQYPSPAPRSVCGAARHSERAREG